jgi:DNA-binding NarL/FixJ family response regulator
MNSQSTVFIPLKKREIVENFGTFMDHAILPTRTAGLDPIKLTPRQKDVLRQLTKGFGVKRVASELGVSIGTVKTHISMAYTALGTRNRIQAVMRARHLLNAPPN